MTVAQIPGGARAVIHDPVIALGVGDEASVLHGIQEPLSIVLGIGPLLPQEIGKYGDDLTLAGLVVAGERCMTIGGGVRLPRRQASVALARNSGGLRIDVVEVG